MLVDSSSTGDGFVDSFGACTPDTRDDRSESGRVWMAGKCCRGYFAAGSRDVDVYRRVVGRLDVAVHWSVDGDSW